VKSGIGQAAYKSTEIHSCQASYDIVASEYYDADLHPTCADFRAASRVYLKKVFDAEAPRGRIADVGCGRSLVLEFVSKDLVLVDESRGMVQGNMGGVEVRIANIEMGSFGHEEFDWIFAILGDPYNTPAAWGHIFEALRPKGQCIFITPSVVWAKKFRERDKGERSGFARFVLSGGRSVYLRSLIFPVAEQRALIDRSNLKLIEVHSIFASELPNVRSPKISQHLSDDDPVVDVYRVSKL
jgi:hypothetical protein